MRDFFRKRWFLVSLLGLITAGLTFGANVDTASIDVIVSLVPPRIVTAIVLFLMGRYDGLGACCSEAASASEEQRCGKKSAPREFHRRWHS